VRVDGKKTALFPAYYLFIGFKIPIGSHVVQMRFVPPWFWAGLFINVCCIIGLVILFRKFYRSHANTVTKAGN